MINHIDDLIFGMLKAVACCIALASVMAASAELTQPLHNTGILLIE